MTKMIKTWKAIQQRHYPIGQVNVQSVAEDIDLPEMDHECIQYITPPSVGAL